MRTLGSGLRKFAEDPFDGEFAELGHMHFIRAVGDTTEARSGEDFGKECVLADALSAKHLNGAIGHVLRHLGAYDLDHGNVVSGSVKTVSVHHVGSLIDEQAALLDLAARTSNLVLDTRLGIEGFAESDTLRRAFAHQFEAALGEAYEAHGVLETPRAKPSLGDLEATSFPFDHVADRNTNIREAAFPFSSRRVEAPEGA